MVIPHAKCPGGDVLSFHVEQSFQGNRLAYADMPAARLSGAPRFSQANDIASLSARMAPWTCRVLRTGGSARCVSVSLRLSPRSRVLGRPSPPGATGAWRWTCGAGTPTRRGGGVGGGQPGPAVLGQQAVRGGVRAAAGRGRAAEPRRAGAALLARVPRPGDGAPGPVASGRGGGARPAGAHRVPSTTGTGCARCWPRKSRCGSPGPRTANRRCSTGTWSVNWSAGSTAGASAGSWPRRSAGRPSWTSPSGSARRSRPGRWT